MRPHPVLWVLLVQSMMVGLVRTQLCSWVESVGQWSTGQRDLLKLNIHQYSTYWNVTFKFDQDVIFEVTSNYIITTH